MDHLTHCMDYSNVSYVGYWTILLQLPSTSTTTKHNNIYFLFLCAGFVSIYCILHVFVFFLCFLVINKKKSIKKRRTLSLVHPSLTHNTTQHIKRHIKPYHLPVALWQQKEETSWGMFDQSQKAAEAGEVTHSSDTSPVTPHAHTPPQHTTRFGTKVGTCLRVCGIVCMCVCVCLSNTWLSGLVKNSCGEAEDL